MKTKLKMLVTSAFVAALFICCLSAFQSYGKQVICPNDNFTMTVTGKTKMLPNGKIAREYQCSMGHSAWVVD